MTAPVVGIAAASPRHELSQSADAPKLAAAQGCIIITAGTDNSANFDIYSITGQLVKRVHLTEGQIQIELPRGCYIVKCERWSKKIVVG